VCVFKNNRTLKSFVSLHELCRCCDVARKSCETWGACGAIWQLNYGVLSNTETLFFCPITSSLTLFQDEWTALLRNFI